MNISYHRWFSENINQDMELKSYGTEGVCLLAFPTLGGHFYDFENFEMVASITPWINNGKVNLYALDSIDNQSWLCKDLLPAERAKVHEQYFTYVTEEVIPFIHHQTHTENRIFLVGCDMGGYHASNFFFRRPDLFSGFLSMSGFFDLQRFTDDFVDETIYYNSPLHYLPRLTDLWYLDQFRQSQIIICSGQGIWERQMVANAYALQRILQEKDIPHKLELWGFDADHDWVWWRKQFPYYLETILHSEEASSSDILK